MNYQKYQCTSRSLTIVGRLPGYKANKINWQKGALVKKQEEQKYLKLTNTYKIDALLTKIITESQGIYLKTCQEARMAYILNSRII